MRAGVANRSGVGDGRTKEKRIEKKKRGDERVKKKISKMKREKEKKKEQLKRKNE